MDIPCAPILADITVNGRTMKAVAQPTKQAWVYVFDRTTGQPVWPIEERRCPKGDVPGEWYSPTQPFPTKPPAFDRQGVSIDDLIDFTPELRAEALKLVSRYKIGPIFTPPVVSKSGRTAGDADPAVGQRRRELAGRRARSRDAHRVHLLGHAASRPSAWFTDPAISDMNYMHGTARTGAAPDRRRRVVGAAAVGAVAAGAGAAAAPRGGGAGGGEGGGAR